MTTLADLIQDESLDELRQYLEESGTLEIAEEFSRLSPEDSAIAFRLLPKDRALTVFEALDAVHQQELLDGLRAIRSASSFTSWSLTTARNSSTRCPLS